MSLVSSCCTFKLKTMADEEGNQVLEATDVEQKGDGKTVQDTVRFSF